MGFFKSLKEGLKKTRDGILGQIDALFKRFTKIDEELFEELEELLIAGDVGMLTAEKICDTLRDKVKSTGTKDPQEVRDLLVETIAELLEGDMEMHLDTKPSVILVIGVNGVGKTTTIGKLCAKYRKEGKKCVIAAADTFRAAAIEQLQVWCDRAGVEMIKQNEGSDPAAVVFDACVAAKKRDADVLIVDTAGRLQNKKNLMDELAKIDRVISRELPNSDRETLLVLDSTTGQNAVLQAVEFKSSADITGLVLTKLDGTAKGGAIFSIKGTLDIPVKYIGVGEQIDDLQPFDPAEFVKALLE